MGHWLYRNIVEPGKLPLLLALTAFVVTFAVTRVVVRMIRAGKGPFGNVQAGGLHIHHVVPGVILMVVGGFGSAASGTNDIGAAVSAVLFGMGAGLVLDEFALVLHLDDVYWSEAGRQSVEVVVVTATLVGLLLVGFAPFGVNDISQGELQGRGTVVSDVAVNFLFSLIALSKGKPRVAIFGVVIPVLALIGAVRLARPGSPWARRFYARRPRARARAALRAYRHDRRWAGPSRALQDWIGGRPNPPPPLDGPASDGAAAPGVADPDRGPALDGPRSHPTPALDGPASDGAAAPAVPDPERGADPGPHPAPGPGPNPRSRPQAGPGR